MYPKQSIHNTTKSVIDVLWGIFAGMAPAKLQPPPGSLPPFLIRKSDQKSGFKTKLRMKKYSSQNVKPNK